MIFLRSNQNTKKKGRNRSTLERGSSPGSPVNLLILHKIMLPYDYFGLPGVPYAARLALIGLYSSFASLLLYKRNAIRPGRPRLLIAIPIIIINYLLPAIFHPDDEIVTVAVVGLNLMWLASLKASIYRQSCCLQLYNIV